MQDENNIDVSEHRQRKKGVFLSDAEIATLKNYNIFYDDYPNTKSLLFRIEEELNEMDPSESEDLEQISLTLSEYAYYHDTHK